MIDRVRGAFSNEKGAYYLAFYTYVQWEWLSRTRLLGDTSFVVAVELVVQASIIALLGYSFLKQRATVFQWLCACILCVFSLIAWRVAAEGWLFWLVLFVICGKGTKMKPLACIVCFAVVITIAASLIASGAGLIENRIDIRTDGTMRNPMGFDHPNSFGAALLTLCVSLAPLFNVKGRLFLSLIGIAFSIAASEVADSRTAAICLILIALTLPIFDWMGSKKRGNNLGKVLLITMLVITVVSIAYMIFFDGSRPLDATLDKALSGRLRLGHVYYNDHMPGLLGYDFHDGTPYYTNGKEYNFVVDNLYMHVFLRYGILAGLLLFGSLIALSIKMIQEKYCGIVLFGLGIFAIYGAAETLGCRIESNFYILSLWTLLYKCPVGYLDNSLTTGQLSGDGTREISFHELMCIAAKVAKDRND